MDSNQEHPLYPPDAETLPVAIYVVETGRRGKVRYWIDKKSFRSLPSSKSTRLAKRLSERPRL